MDETEQILRELQEMSFDVQEMCAETEVLVQSLKRILLSLGDMPPEIELTRRVEIRDRTEAKGNERRDEGATRQRRSSDET